MTPTVLRQLWSVVETTQSHILLRLDDAHLVQWLLKQTKTKTALNQNELDVLSDYIRSRLNLIRDLAENRQPS
ncbi:hypothetical protein [Gloeocapsopsis dulcis]|uniref:Uncharacterized protein n=1 Tax=Gloeocapsopsis dulcis AAB1 = 1H9 TaxID=1433147 RepID=A0A6N8G2P3_9CHRO|nr:hypothetical protein [Gloeocapsopsis dulcis]MUL39132.1 hypothetical protein [Gloeocapsopsis dulcis AAB1 = 1H9]WNN90733.1 hypothetical protein P0S91_06540 [Gloeocapsopsis dulcis]